MEYTPYNWRTGETVTSNKLNHMEDGISNAAIEINELKALNPFTGEVDVTDAERNQALANVSNQTANSTTGKMGYKVLDPTKTFTEQVTAENTIYEIRDVFDIDDDFTMPSNCTLRLNGGIISGNNELVFDNTRLDGYGSILCDYSGSVIGRVDATLFGLKQDDNTFDNAPIINKICETFNYVIINGTNYYCSTTIYISKPNGFNLEVNANLIYTVENTSNEFITIRGANIHVAFNGIVRGPKQLIPSGDTSERSIGINIQSCYNAKFYINEVMHFYECVRIKAANGEGVSYSRFEFNTLARGRILLHLLAEGTGWITGLDISFNRMTKYSGNTNVETAILMEAEQLTFSEVIFEKGSIEGITSSEPIKITNAHNVDFRDIRNESNYSIFALLNKCREIVFNSSYQPTTIRSVDGQSYAKEINDDLVEYKPLQNSFVGMSPGNAKLDILFNSVKFDKTQATQTALSYYPIGFIVPIAYARQINNFNANMKYTLYIVFYDSSFNYIPTSEAYLPHGYISFKLSTFLTNIGYETTSLSDITNAVFGDIPSNASYVGFFFKVENNSKNIDSFVVKTQRNLINNMDKTYMVNNYIALPNYGISNNRPDMSQVNYSQYLVGFQYFDTTLGKYICWNGTAWVNLDGTALS